MRHPLPLFSLIIATSLFSTLIGHGAILLIDDFSDGPFSLLGQYGESLDDKGIQFGTMLGGDRYTALTSSSRQFGVTAVLVTGTSEFSFDANTGPVGPSDNQGVFYALYGVPLTLRDFSGYSGLELSISTVSGTGIVDVWLGGTSFSTSVSQAGLVFIPIEGSSFTSVSEVRLQFTAVTNDFSISVDRFSAVPEPSTFLLLAAGIGLCLRRNRRSEQDETQQPPLAALSSTSLVS
jgi:hypothetical protein